MCGGRWPMARSAMCPSRRRRRPSSPRCGSFWRARSTCRRRLGLLAATAQSAPIRGGKTAIGDLTERQREVLVLVARGLQNKEIGELLGLADKTVKTHVTAIFRTLHVINRTQAASLAREAKLV
jgi:DNA-binding NarL/FixJ family response regulator